ncbi:alkaline phosphatase family protein [Sulfodiicoccus acidiphilus]|uniref:alkaline phosphatase family protein n=1 Tax=Sulfodiicoccus acidiphilus TaxID=1670455 RepID=UPI0030B810EC
MTTIFTAQPPCTHRVVGEKVWSKELAGLINPLRYTYSALKVSNELRDVKREKDLFRLRTFIAESKHVVTAVLPWWLSSSELTSTLYGGAEVVPCYNVWDCLHLFQTSLGKGTLTILYLNDVDVLSHKYGHGTKVVTSAAFQIVEQLRRMSSKIPVVLTSDHGFVDVEKRVFLDQDATLSQMLELPPFGEPRALFMNSRFDLKTFLYNRYPKLEVMSREEVEAHQLMGQCTDYSRLDFDYVAVPVDLSSYRYRLTEQDNILFKGEHGGLTSEELEVPLVTLGG